MIHIVQLDVPRCPECSSLMFHRDQSDNMQYLICYHCMKPYMLIGYHKSDKEIVVTDDVHDIELMKD